MNSLEWTIALCLIVICSTLMDVYQHTKIRSLTNELARVGAESNHASKILVPNLMNGDGITIYKVIALNNMDLGNGITAHTPVYIDEANYELLVNFIRTQVVTRND